MNTGVRLQTKREWSLRHDMVCVLLSNCQKMGNTESEISDTMSSSLSGPSNDDVDFDIKHNEEKP